ncbi:MAG: AraC family transcriptional regulator [Bacteroidetes bacterium]|nr:MAG: AraC family transcriptional regulator [Bacteroidota bacterium]
MRQPEKLTEFYQRKFQQVPTDLGRTLGHFNVFQLDPFVGKHAKPVPYRKRDFYKIMLAFGSGRVHYADRFIEVHKQVLSFSNPLIPYKWEHNRIQSGYFCIFDRAFFQGFGDISRYGVFQPGGSHLFELKDEQVPQIEQVFTRMMAEMASDYVHKEDLMRNLVFELLHLAAKMSPDPAPAKRNTHAAERITSLFFELLERQFPIEEAHPQVRLRTASDFADHLNVHVNHLNRVLKETTQKTTTQHIAERMLQEAKVMLRHHHWNVSEIAYSLGFSEPAHFNHFFKKHLEISPSQFRSA